MPSAPSYKRNYKQEYFTSQASAAEKKRRAARNKARRTLEDEGRVKKGDGKDVAHKKALIKGGSNSRSNWSVQGASANRSFKRTKKAGMK